MADFSWVGGVVKVILDALASLIGRRKPKIHVHPVGPAIWCIAREGDQELMQVVMWANVTHEDTKQGLVLMEVYPQGTKPHLYLGSRELIRPGDLVHIQLSAFVKPIIGT